MSFIVRGMQFTASYEDKLIRRSQMKGIQKKHLLHIGNGAPNDFFSLEIFGFAETELSPGWFWQFSYKGLL